MKLVHLGGDQLVHAAGWHRRVDGQRPEQHRNKLHELMKKMQAGLSRLPYRLRVGDIRVLSAAGEGDPLPWMHAVINYGFRAGTTIRTPVTLLTSTVTSVDGNPRVWIPPTGTAAAMPPTTPPCTLPAPSSSRSPDADTTNVFCPTSLLIRPPLQRSASRAGDHGPVRPPAGRRAGVRGPAARRGRAGAGIPLRQHAPRLL